MVRSAGKRFVCAVLLHFFLFVFCSCSSTREIQEIKQKMVLDEDLSMAICWPETSLYGIQLRRIVNNYNLSASVRVQLRFSDRETEYLENLRRQTATANLPDIFITMDHPKELFWRANDKMLDLEPVRQALESTDARGIDALRSADKTDGIFLTAAIEGISVYNAFLPKQKQDDLADIAVCALESSRACEEILKVEFDVDEFSDNGDAADYLAMLIQSKRNFVYDKDMARLLTVWKETVPLFGKTQREQGTERIPPNVLAFYHSGLVTDENYIPLTSSYVEAATFQGYRYYISAAAQGGNEQKENVFRFLTYLLEETDRLWGSVEPQTDKKLLTRELTVAELEWVNEQLRLYAKDMIDTSTCVELLEECFSGTGG